MRQLSPQEFKQIQKNIAIFEDTVSIINKGYYRTDSGKTILLEMEGMIEGTECYHHELPSQTIHVGNSETQICIEDQDCLETAEHLILQGYSPILLSFANAHHPGGSVTSGAIAQEETICRRSTLIRSIYTLEPNYASHFGYPFKEGNGYPLINHNYSVIYSPAVTVFKQGKECTLMEHPFRIAIISCAALHLASKNLPQELKPDFNGHLSDEAKRITLNKIRTIFRLGLMHGHDAMILGAFGCGAFRNPPDDIAAMFHAVLGETEFKHKFRLVCFSILADPNSGNKNLNAFREEFRVI